MSGKSILPLPRNNNNRGNLIALNTVVLVIEELDFLPLLYKYAFEHSPAMALGSTRF